MYGWGTDTDYWRGPGTYKYDSDRAPYLDELAKEAKKKPSARTYTKRRAPDFSMVDPVGKTISSDAENLVVVGIDVTGSMSSWPLEIFDRLPMLYQTLSQYKPDLEVCFAAIGDATCDSYPLQVNDFGKGLDLEDHINALCPEGGGGGQISESYELFAYYLLNHCNIPNAKSPFLIVYGDEKFYNQVRPNQVRYYVGDPLSAPLDAGKIWQDLTKKFNLFYLQKSYGDGSRPSIDQEVYNHWANAIGEQRVYELPFTFQNADGSIMPGEWRAVDIAMGIIARHWGQYDDFTQNMGARQDDKIVADVTSSMKDLPDDPESAKEILEKIYNRR